MVQLTDRLDSKNEAKWQSVWGQRQLYAFDEKDTKRPVFSIDTPPPFTSGDLHMGHVLSYSYFDFVARYKRMSGFSVYYPQGWDCQGFPTEVKVEQKYGRQAPANFRKLCVEWTTECIARMRAQMNQMGFSPDWKYEYQTMSPDYHRRVQYSLLEMYKSNQVYRGEHPVFWCPNCQSALAKTDTEEADRQTQLHDIKFELELTDGKRIPVTIATTRPELMHACAAVLFHPTDERYKNLKVKHAVTALGKSVPFKPDPDVDPAFGTGVVMACTFGDKQDVVWMYRHKLPMVRALDERGKISNHEGHNGLSVSDSRAKLLEQFKSEGKLLSSKPLSQVIKVHDRCKKPIELALSWQWFARVTDAKDSIIHTAAQMRWVPDFAITYLTDWAQYVEWDWVISRQRVFGTPLPFWHCKKCDKIIPADAKELPVDPPHMASKACPTCSGPLTPEASTCDCWIDSSISPLVIGRWPDDKKFLARVYPASLRPQGVEIVRTWAYYTIYRCKELTGQAPFKELLLNGNVLAPDGKKMSKSLGNIIAPDKLISDYGADSVRIWAALSGAMAKDRPFSYQDMQYAKSFLTKLLNAGKLVQKSIEGYEPNAKTDADIEKHLRPIDKYFLHRLHSVVTECNAAWGDYEFHRITKSTQEFFWHEFCDYYLEYVKSRIYDEKDAASKRAAQYTLHAVYRDVLLLLSPFIPHSTEELWQIYSSSPTDSIHLQSYPAPDARFASPEYDAAGLLLAQAIAAIRQEKANNKLPLNCPVTHLTLTLPAEQAKLVVSIKEEIEAAGRVEKLTVKEGAAFALHCVWGQPPQRPAAEKSPPLQSGGKR